MIGKLSLKNLKIAKKDPYEICKDSSINQQDFDYAIIGGGSGGVASASKAGKLGLKTILFDFVEPSPQGSKWGLGGTCVNVGCVPKKLMHNSAIIKETLKLSEFYGYGKTPYEAEFDWNTLVNNIQLHIKATNYDTASGLKGEDVKYVNCMATLKDPNTILYSPDPQEIYHFIETGEVRDENKVGTLNSKYSLVAVGGRPKLMKEEDCPGAHYSLTSDDIFSLEKPPGKTLVVGSGYIGVECTSFLHKMGFETTLLARSTVLRGFDQGVIGRLKEFMIDKFGMDVREGYTCKSITKDAEKDGYNVEIVSTTNPDEAPTVEYFDTILMAISREALTDNLNLSRIGVELNGWNKKVIGGHNGEMELTSVDNIYAVGDMLEGVPELTPTAIISGVNVAEKVYNRVNKVEEDRKEVDFSWTPTTIFSYPEYSMCGYSEEEAIEKYGEENVEVWHMITTPLEESLRMEGNFLNGEFAKMTSYFKVICKTDEDDKVIGMHYLGQHAGEVIQGYAVSLTSSIPFFAFFPVFVVFLLIF